MFTTVPFLALHNGAMDVRNHHVGARNAAPKLRNDGTGIGNSNVCIDSKFGLGTQGQEDSHGNDGTHIEDVKEPVQVRPPPRYLFLVVLRVDKSRDYISLALLDGVPLNRRRGSVVRLGWATRSTNYWYNSQRQLLDRFVHRVVEVVQPLLLQSPVESGAYLGAGQPEFYIFYLIDQVILSVLQFVTDAIESQKVAYSDHPKDDSDGTKSSIGWRIARDFLGDIEDFDKSIQR